MRWGRLAGGLAIAGVAGWYARTGRYASIRWDRPGRPPYDESGGVRAGDLEVVHEFHGAMPTGVTVSREGRIFVNYPRWEDPIDFTVAELREGREVPFPDAGSQGDASPDQLFSVQSVVVDPADRLWALDTGTVDMGPIRGRDWAKLVGIDLATGRIVKTIRFPPGVVHETTYLNDVRFDLRRGDDGMAFITDSSSSGPNGIIVVDLASGRSWRKLNDHPSVRPDRAFFAVLDGGPVMLRPRDRLLPKPAAIGSDGIAIAAGGTRLFYCPLSSRSLYSVSVDALADEGASDADVARTIEREDRRFASDGLEADLQGRIYLTDWEHNAIVVRTPEGRYETLVWDPRLWWPDTLSLSDDGYLYVTANQLQRQAKFHRGRDLRRRPFHLFRLAVNATPVRLSREAPRAAAEGR
ncbi:MAG TPA: L-dopachrome tautomerase-related protein [Thermodesulfobacteriota bacterium]